MRNKNFPYRSYLFKRSRVNGSCAGRACGNASVFNGVYGLVAACAFGVMVFGANVFAAPETRAVEQATPDTKEYGPTAYNPDTGTLFLGAPGETTDKSIISAKLGADRKVAIKDLANETDLQKKIALLTLGYTGFPVFVEDAADMTKVVMFKDAGGTGARAQGQALKTHGSKEVKGIFAIAATPGNKVYTGGASGTAAPFIFAAVSDTKDNFSTAKEPGIALVRVVDDATLFAHKSADLFDDTDEANNAAAKIDPTAVGKLIAIGDAATINDDTAVSMFWDEHFKLLYVALKKVTNKDKENTNGVLGLFVGKIDPTAPTDGNKGQLVLEPIADIGNIGLFDINTDKFKESIFGGAGDGTSVPEVHMSLPRVMHTSTGKDYLIVVGGTDLATAADGLATWVNALPLVGTGNAGAGKLAKVTDFKSLLAAEGDAPKVDRAATGGPVVVGFSPKLIGGTDTKAVIQDMQVVGDTVYVSVQEARKATTLPAMEEAGIFQSTAIFNDKGVIIAWTPWQRVADSVIATKAFGFGVDPNTGTVIFLAGDKKVIRSTAWGKNADVAATSRELDTELVKTAGFESTKGPFRVFAFDAETPGFEKYLFSMAVAVGGNRVALIETSKKATDKLDPTAKFANDTSIFYKDIPADQDIGVLTCAEWSRATNGGGKKGFVYVGGSKGLARLSDKNGDGYDISTLLATLEGTGSDDKFPAGTAGTVGPWTFKKIAEWNDEAIVAIAADGNNVGTPKLYVLSMDKFAITGLDGKTLGDGETAFDGTDIGFGRDMIVAGDADTKIVAIIATTTGVFVTKNGTDFEKVQGIDVEEDGVPVELSYLSQTRGVNSPKGNLFVMTVNTCKDQAKIFRFNVDATKALNGATNAARIVQKITGAEVYNLGQYRRGMAVDSSIALTSLSNKKGEQAKQVRVEKIYDRDGGLQGTASGADLSELLVDDYANNKTTKNYVGRPVRDTACGGWIIPGDWGVRVGE